MPDIKYLFAGEYTLLMDVGGSGMNSITLVRADQQIMIIPVPGLTDDSKFRLYRVVQDGTDLDEYILTTPYIKLTYGETSYESEHKVSFSRSDAEHMIGMIAIDRGTRLKFIPPGLPQEFRIKYDDKWFLIHGNRFWLQPDNIFTTATWKVRRTLGPSYEKADLRGVDLRVPSWKDVNYTGAKLGKSRLNDSHFMSCKFDGADLSGAVCQNTKFGAPGALPSSLEAADFNGTNIGGAQFFMCSMAGAKMSAAIFSPATSFEMAKLREANFAGAKLAGVNFSGTDLSGADFKGADFGDANLSGAILDGAILDEADLRKVQFSSNRPPRFHAPDAKADAKKASLVKAKLKASLLGSDWSLLDLTNATIEDIPPAITKLQAKHSLLGPLVLTERNLTDADFTGSILNSVNFTKATLTGAVMSGLDLRSTTLTGATLTDANLNEASLREMTISGATLTRTKLVGADCTGANLTGCLATEPCLFSNDPKKRTGFLNATVPAALLGLDWEALDLRQATIVSLPENLTKLNASYALLHDINLENKILVEANFDHAELRGASLSKSNLTSATFRKASLQGGDGKNACDLSQAFMKNAVFEDANLTGVSASYVYFFETQASVVRATLAGCNFSNAYLSGVNFSGVGGNALRGVSFVGACLVNAKFNGVKFSNYGDNSCSLNKACLQGADFSNATLSGTFMGDAAISENSGTMKVTRRMKYKGTPETRDLEYDKTIIDPASATNSATKCPAGGNGPCIDKMISPTAPTSWHDSSGT